MRRSILAVLGPVLLLTACSTATPQGDSASSAPAGASSTPAPAPSASAPSRAASAPAASGSAAPAPFFNGCKRAEFDTDAWDQLAIVNEGGSPVTLALDPATLIGFDEDAPRGSTARWSLAAARRSSRSGFR